MTACPASERDMKSKLIQLRFRPFLLTDYRTPRHIAPDRSMKRVDMKPDLRMRYKLVFVSCRTVFLHTAVMHVEMERAVAGYRNGLALLICKGEETSLFVSAGLRGRGERNMLFGYRGAAELNPAREHPIRIGLDFAGTVVGEAFKACRKDEFQAGSRKRRVRSRVCAEGEIHVDSGSRNIIGNGPARGNGTVCVGQGVRNRDADMGAEHGCRIGAVKSRAGCRIGAVKSRAGCRIGAAKSRAGCRSRSRQKLRRAGSAGQAGEAAVGTMPAPGRFRVQAGQTAFRADDRAGYKAGTPLTVSCVIRPSDLRMASCRERAEEAASESQERSDEAAEGRRRADI